ncbi:hypothetical protein JXA70_02160 [candidate division KSB1 bacterium]|nr:hypothetical protein [candidate division KSB1 bacterium]
MPKVKTFTSDPRIYKTAGQLETLDQAINDFIASYGVETKCAIYFL